MISTVRDVLGPHAKSMLLTFEIFWVLIFLLDRLGGQAASGIPQFIYVNF